MNDSIHSSAIADTLLNPAKETWWARWRNGEAGTSSDSVRAPDRARGRTFPALTPGTRNSANPSEPDFGAMTLLRAQLTSGWFKPAHRRALAIMSIDEADKGPSIATRLAVACAKLGDKTLLIDADTRAATASAFFNCSRAVGFSSVLGGRVCLREAIVQTRSNGLSILPAGPAAECTRRLFDDDTVLQSIETTASDYDLILIDGPRLTASADALLVANSIGGVLVTVGRHVTKASELRQACTQLRSMGVTIVGAVFTDV